MATTSLWPIKMTINKTINYVENKDKTRIPLSNLSISIDYAKNKNKTEEQFYVTGINCDSDNVYQDMMRVKKAYNKFDGIQGFHGYQSFKEKEVTPELAHKIGIEFAKEMWGDDFQVVVTTHLNTNHIHNHFVVNSVSIKDGHKYNYSNKEMARLRKTNDFICEEHNISHLEEKPTPKKHIDFNYYLNHDNYSTRTQAIIDMAIKNALNYADFKDIMKKNNYEVIERYGKLSVRAFNKNRNIRIERQFGSDYSIDRINERILEETSDKLTMEELEQYNYHKRNYINNQNSLIAQFLFIIFKIKVYQKSPRNYPLSPAMRKEVDKMEKYSMEIVFMNDNKIDSKEELQIFKQMNKELLDDLIYTRKRTYEYKSKTKDKVEKEECDLRVDFYNEIIKELQTKVKTCKMIEHNHKIVEKELETRYSKEQKRLLEL
ncbi:MAG: relaxase/mobilization nuclease domain-containing protein [Bacilli bacterium]|nr:relaxase/mobilization nuclease domain-containing protein [Bacilli bacterium]